MPLPLEGVRVLDLTNVMAGPYCSMVLGDMGAEVIKIENFPEGDTSRRFEPQVNGESYCFAVLNRNKKSLALDMKNPRGKADRHRSWRNRPTSCWRTSGPAWCASWASTTKVSRHATRA